MSSSMSPLVTPTRLTRSGVVPPAPVSDSLFSTSSTNAPSDSKRSVSLRLSRIAFSSSHSRGVLDAMDVRMPKRYYNSGDSKIKSPSDILAASCGGSRAGQRRGT